ncbi:MAG: Thiol-disulfide isomerase or thioredoxin [Chloroflexi bacterium]|nr:MAG: Thiol-disulfide isomerase or thioredoxin [Chloroflexota bacterium]
MQKIYKFSIPILLIFFLTITVVGCEGDDKSSKSLINAPQFELELFQNSNNMNSLNLNLADDLNNHPIVINFWYPSCPPCREEIPALEKAYKKYKGDGLEIIGIQSLVLDSIEDGKEFVIESGITYGVGADVGSSIQISYKVIGFPTTYFLNRNHEIVRKWSGLLDNAQLEQFIVEILE